MEENVPVASLPEQQSTLTKSFETKTSSLFTRSFVLALLVIVILGLGTGYMISRSKTTGSANPLAATPSPEVSSSAKTGDVFGSSDTKTFRDVAEGTLREGGIEGEGQYHLERPGGESQNVYMTSSIVDLSKLVGKKVKVWGETQKAQYAGWLMDVGRVEVL